MSLKIDQAFVNSFINGSFGLETDYQNLPYTPTAQTAFAELNNLPNEISPLSLKDSNETNGIFRITLRYAADTGAIAAKTKAEEIMAYYEIGSTVTYSGQSATITRVQRQAGFNEDGWYTIIVDITYRAFITR